MRAVADDRRTTCSLCEDPLPAVAALRHRCRACGLVVCQNCSPGSAYIPSTHWTSGVVGRPVSGATDLTLQRVCVYCYTKFS